MIYCRSAGRNGLPLLDPDLEGCPGRDASLSVHLGHPLVIVDGRAVDREPQPVVLDGGEFRDAILDTFGGFL